MKQRRLDVEDLRDCVSSKQNVTVDRAQYFALLIRYDVDTFTDKVSYNVWTEFHSKRGDSITIRTAYLKQLLETHDEKIKDY